MWAGSDAVVIMKLSSQPGCRLRSGLRYKASRAKSARNGGKGSRLARVQKPDPVLQFS